MRRFFNRAIGALLLCYVSAATLGMVGQVKKAESRKAAGKNPVASTPESIGAGQALFQKYCRFCHGADAKGDGPQAPKDTHPANLTDDRWDHGSTDADIFATIKNLSVVVSALHDSTDLLRQLNGNLAAVTAFCVTVALVSVHLGRPALRRAVSEISTGARR